MRASFLLSSAACVSFLAFAHPARADDPAIPPPPPADDAKPTDEPAETPPPSPPRRTPKHWYGGETLAADAASVVVFSIGANMNDGREQTVFLAGGLASFALAAPIVHAAHGRWGVAAGDVAIRGGAVLVGAISGTLLGAGLASGGAELDGAVSGMVLGAALGALSASVIDATALAREKVEPEETTTAAFTWSPSLVPVRDGVVLGVGGTF